MSAAGKPAAFSRAAIASAALVTLPAGVSVVLISTSSLVDLARPRVVRPGLRGDGSVAAASEHDRRRQRVQIGPSSHEYIALSTLYSCCGYAIYFALMKFAPEYVTYVLNENFEDAKALFLSPLMAIHYAHLVMLAAQGIVSPADAHALREALDGISQDDDSRRSRTTAPTRICSSTSSG